MTQDRRRRAVLLVAGPDLETSETRPVKVWRPHRTTYARVLSEYKLNPRARR